MIYPSAVSSTRSCRESAVNVTTLLLAALVSAPVLPSTQASRPSIRRPIALEVGSGATSRGGLLDLLFAVRDDDASAAERGLADALAGRPWLQVVGAEGEAAVAVSRCLRAVSSRSRSKDGKRTTITFRYAASAGVAIRSDRDSVEAEVLVSHTYSEGASRMDPTASEDREAFRRAGQELAKKVRAWILPRIATLRPDGPDAGFLHKARVKWLVRGDGLEVTNVAAGSPAERADLRVGDRIRRIDAEDGTSEMEERVYTWRLESAGTRVMLEVERDQQRRTLAVELASPQGRTERRKAIDHCGPLHP
jgi:hypothetical protein